MFNQPGVSSALEAQYVPVKLNADENSATAQWYGVNRVPTDVIITPDGQLVGKLVSPPTSIAYVSELTSLASKYASKSGRAYATAAANAPAQPQINAAYAGLQIAPNTPLAIAPATAGSNNSFAAMGTGASPFGAGNASTSTIGQFPSNPGLPAIPGAAPTSPMYNSASVGYPMASQPGLPPAPQPAMNPMVAVAQPPITPVGQSPTASPAAQVPNPYYSATTSAPPTQQAPPTPLTAPMPSATGYGATFSAPPLGVPNAAIAPPMGAAASTALGPALPGGTPDPTKLPPGSPPLGFDGYCPVTMRNSWKWVAGNPQWGIVHRGRTYWFAGPEEQKQFWTDPDRYTPALSGMDPVLAIDHHQQVPGKREHSLDFDGLFYMFASEATLQQFSANPQRYAAGVRQAMGIPRGRLVR